MPYENKPGTGVLFPNDRKTKENQPDYTGLFYENVGGKVIERDLAGWRRLNSKGGERINVVVSDKFQASRVGPPLETPPAKPDKEFNDEIPGW